MSLDLAIFNFLNNLAGQSLFWDTFFVYLASHYSYVVILLVLFLVFAKYKMREKVRIFLVATGAAVVSRFLVTEIIRLFYNRPRPFNVMEVNQLIFHDGYGSFPSGHATFFFAFATAVYFYNKKWGAVFLGAFLLMTISRVIVGVHWPSDILGGFIIGVIVAALSVWISKKLSFNYRQRQ